MFRPEPLAAHLHLYDVAHVVYASITDHKVPAVWVLWLVLLLVLLSKAGTFLPRRVLRINEVITIEEHFMSSAYLAASKGGHTKFQSFKNVEDLGDARISDMDKGKISLQVVSLSPGPPDLFTPKICQLSNDQLYQGIRSSRGRLAGFATLPMSDIPHAVLELEKAVQDYGFKGALVNNHVDGEFYDDLKFRPIFEKAQELDVPIYLHPCPPNEGMNRLLYSSLAYDENAAFALGTAGFGWHEMTGLHILRLLLSGLFDHLPKLQIIIGHAGEGLPLMLARSAERLKPALDKLGIKRGLWSVMRENISITTAGFFTLPVLKLMLAVMPIERILFSVDYPYSDNTTGLAFLQEIARAGIMTQVQFDAFTHINARRLLRL